MFDYNITNKIAQNVYKNIIKKINNDTSSYIDINSFNYLLIELGIIQNIDIDNKY